MRVCLFVGRQCGARCCATQRHDFDRASSRDDRGIPLGGPVQSTARRRARCSDANCSAADAFSAAAPLCKRTLPRQCALAVHSKCALPQLRPLRLNHSAMLCIVGRALAGDSASDCACVPVHARACTHVQVRSISFAQKPRADDIGALWQLVNGAIDSLGMLVPITTCAVEVPSHRCRSCALLRIT